MAATDNTNQNLVVTAFWEVNPGEEGAIARPSERLSSASPARARREGIPDPPEHRKPRKFFFYEVFAGEAAFAEHQQTEHFKNIIVGQAIPKLAKRERSQFRFI